MKASDLHQLAHFTPMPNIFQSLLLVIANATQKELARQIKYLKVENEVLRGKLPGRITITPKEPPSGAWDRIRKMTRHRSAAPGLVLLAGLLVLLPPAAS